MRIQEVRMYCEVRVDGRILECELDPNGPVYRVRPKHVIVIRSYEVYCSKTNYERYSSYISECVSHCTHSKQWTYRCGRNAQVEAILKQVVQKHRSRYKWIAKHTQQIVILNQLGDV